MTIFEFKRKLENIINPYIYRYEHDTKSKMYYFTLYRANLNNIFFTISEKTLKDDKQSVARLQNIKERYF